MLKTYLADFGGRSFRVARVLGRCPTLTATRRRAGWLLLIAVLRVGDKGERSISLLVTQEAARELVWMENFGQQIRIVRQG